MIERVQFQIVVPSIPHQFRTGSVKDGESEDGGE